MTIWFLLDAFDIPQTLENAGLVQVSSSVATLFPITPAGIGTEQAFLLYVLNGVASASVLLAFSVGAKLTLTVTNVVAGFTAIALTLRTVRYRKALDASTPETAGESRTGRPCGAARRGRARSSAAGRERPRAPPATPRGSARRSRSAG